MIKIGIVGAGKLASGFARLFVEENMKNSVQLVGIYSRTTARAVKLAGEVGCQVMSLAEVQSAGDLLFILISDRAISQVAGELAALAAKSQVGKGHRIAVHCSGLQTSQVLVPLAERGWQVVSLHPLQSVSGRQGSEQALKNCWYTVEGDAVGTAILTELVHKLGAKVMPINARQKVLYHAAACVISNYQTTLVQMAVDLIKEAGFTGNTGQQALWPLLLGTVANIEKVGPAEALTGPVSRGDWQTVREHLVKMAETGSPYLELYRLLGKHTADLALVQGSITGEQQEYFLREVLGGSDR